MTPAPQRPPPRKSYTRVNTGRRLPTDYELVSTDLHYNHPDRFELSAGNPVVDWYLRYREGSPLRVGGWDRFADPRRTTYHGYTKSQDRKEDHVDGVLNQIDETGYDRDLDSSWVDYLDQWYAPLRFPVHGLQMMAAYLAQMAPASAITNCAAFQAGDEMRRVQRIAYRSAQLAAHTSRIDVDAHRRRWEEADPFQPLRELIERALVTYDWGEALVVTNLVVKPHLDRLIDVELAGRLGSANGDPLLGVVHFSLHEDSTWHREWTAELLRVAVADRPENGEIIRRWTDLWLPRARAALEALAQTWVSAPVPLDPSPVVSRISEAVAGEVAAALDDRPDNHANT